MSSEHQKTAADWHGGQWSAMYAYASTGEILSGLDAEIWDCLGAVERGKLDSELDPVDEHERLRALLHHVEPGLAAGEARLIARGHAKGAAALWWHDVVGGRAPNAQAETARHVLRGIDNGDPTVLDGLPGPPGYFTPARLAADCYWPEPSADDRAAHDRWSAAQDHIWEAYTAAFTGEVRRRVVQSCHRELVVATGAPPRPYIRPIPGPHGGTVPAGWAAERLGEWDGSEREVVYDPRRYEVAVASVSAEQAAPGLEAAGWEQEASDGHRGLWIRDRIAATRAALDRPSAPDGSIRPPGGIEL